MTFSYIDSYIWMSWSKFFKGATSIQFKLCEDSNTLDSIITLGSWPSYDEYPELASIEHVYSQLNELDGQKADIPETGTVTFYVRATGDGKQRRTATGASSACSSYPIEDAPEHSSQLGDMTLIYYPSPC